MCDVKVMGMSMKSDLAWPGMFREIVWSSMASPRLISMFLEEADPPDSEYCHQHRLLNADLHVTSCIVQA